MMKKLLRLVGKFLGSHYLWLAIVLGVGLGLRLYKIDGPVADWHSWRQADTSAVSRNFLKYGFNPLYPRFDDLSSVASGKENPRGWRFVEFPIYNLLQAGGYRVFPGWSLEVWGRLVSILASLGSALAIYSLVGRYRGKWWGVVAAATFLWLPFNIFYSRVILPEPLAVLLGLLSYLAAVEWYEKERWWAFWGSGVVAAAAILVKPVAGFLLIPVVFLMWRRYGIRGVVKMRIWGYALLVVAPFLAWRVWMSRFPEGIPAFSWLLNGDGIRFKLAWWRWLWGERVGRLILGIWGVVPFGLGVLVRLKKEEVHVRGLAVGAALYLAIFATGNVRHDYYQIMIVPAVGVILVWGMWWWWQAVGVSKWWGRAFLIFSLVMGWGMSWYQVKEYYKVNRPEIVEAGRRADVLLPKEAKVIAPYGGDSAFLYQTNRQGWPLSTGSMEQMVKLGAQYYVSVNFDEEAKAVMAKNQIIEQTKTYVIVKLKQN